MSSPFFYLNSKSMIRYTLKEDLYLVKNGQFLQLVPATTIIYFDGEWLRLGTNFEKFSTKEILEKFDYLFEEILELPLKIPEHYFCTGEETRYALQLRLLNTIEYINNHSTEYMKYPTEEWTIYRKADSEYGIRPYDYNKQPNFMKFFTKQGAQLFLDNFKRDLNKLI